MIRKDYKLQKFQQFLNNIWNAIYNNRFSNWLKSLFDKTPMYLVCNETDEYIGQFMTQFIYSGWLVKLIIKVFKKSGEEALQIVSENVFLSWVSRTVTYWYSFPMYLFNKPFVRVRYLLIQKRGFPKLASNFRKLKRFERNYVLARMNRDFEPQGKSFSYRKIIIIDENSLKRL